MDNDRQDAAGKTFRELVTDAQRDLFSFVALLLGNTADAKDVMQETNLALLKKAAQYEVDRPFRAWARSIAYYEVLTFRQKQRRERLVFDDEMLDQVSARVMDAEEDEERLARRSAALSACLAKLTRFQRSLVDRRYYARASVSQLARQQDCTEAAVSTLLYRIRKCLADCIRSELARGAVG
jgi:RNA polymerase sigma-70 factor (ECF subfamily)